MKEFSDYYDWKSECKRLGAAFIVKDDHEVTRLYALGQDRTRLYGQWLCQRFTGTVYEKTLRISRFDLPWGQRI